MNELSLYILDLTQNSVAAGAKLIQIRVRVSLTDDRLEIEIIDDGKGMDEAFLKKVVSPFTTTRTTRKVGLGIPMAKQLCEMCEGGFSIESRVGEGTKLALGFRLTHVDLPPMGSLPETIVSLIAGAPECVEFEITYESDGRAFRLYTRELKDTLGDVPLSTPEVLAWIREYAQEGIDGVNRQTQDIIAEV